MLGLLSVPANAAFTCADPPLVMSGENDERKRKSTSPFSCRFNARAPANCTLPAIVMLVFAPLNPAETISRLSRDDRK